ncbi:alpha/beta hydrolase [Nocardia sp. NBC_00881]|uniref:alpha/beta fold hydrolase n=1 Tax=Nocardia sp. NBC_00881 TaxID=2975995 RepID=UPI00386EB4DA|nr:alpha/beta hydrolase [Nocardia sp. NBC_00881]
MIETTIGPLHVADTGPSDGPVALAWPSLWMSGDTTWGAVLPSINDSGWRTLLIDPPGTGNSPSSPTTFSMEQCADAAFEVLDAAGVCEAAVLGLSWGGFVGLRMSLRAPERVSGLVLSNTSARRGTFVNRSRDRLVSFILRNKLPLKPGSLVEAGMLAPQYREKNPVFSGHLRESVDRLDPVGIAMANKSVMVDRTDISGDLGRIKTPTLVISGSVDKGLPPEHSRDLSAGMPNARLEMLEGVGHLSAREQPEVVIGLIKNFLSELPNTESRSS